MVLGVWWSVTVAQQTHCARDTSGHRVYDYSLQTVDGSGTIRLADYKGKVILLVNTATY